MGRLRHFGDEQAIRFVQEAENVGLKDIANHLPEEIAAALSKDIFEIRLRSGRPAQMIGSCGERFVGRPVDAATLRRIALSMMEHSYYACEPELARGYFTMKNGCRVGVCGSFVQTEHGRTLRAIGSLCIRMSREVHGCADEMVHEMANSEGVCSALILSRPGLGKTTMLRDAARQLSELGFPVGIADERHEIAASRDGVPTMDVGPRTDVVDGCDKEAAIEHLIRSMAPRILVTDEIGSACDERAIRRAVRMGVAVMASAHASSFEEFESSAMGALVLDGLFPLAVLLDGQPGKIAGIKRYGRGN